jgi:hypothetical protein
MSCYGDKQKTKNFLVPANSDSRHVQFKVLLYNQLNSYTPLLQPPARLRGNAVGDSTRRYGDL